MDLAEFYNKLSKICREQTVGKLEALVDSGNGIENRQPITDILYDDTQDTVIIYVDGRDGIY